MKKTPTWYIVNVVLILSISEKNSVSRVIPSSDDMEASD